MRAWLLAEMLLREGRAYFGRGQVRYQELVKLFEYLRGGSGDIKTWDPRGKNEPAGRRISYLGKVPAREGGFADVEFPVTAVWDPWFADARRAIALATSADIQHPTRTTYVPHRGNMGKKGWSVGSRDVQNPPQLGPGRRIIHPGERGPEPVDFAARPTDRYDMIVQGDMSGVPENPGGRTSFGDAPRGKGMNPRVIATRIAWTPAEGDPNERAARLRSLLAGNQPEPRSRQELPSGPEAPRRPTPADQSKNPLGGETPHHGKMRVRDRGDS